MRHSASSEAFCFFLSQLCVDLFRGSFLGVAAMLNARQYGWVSLIVLFSFIAFGAGTVDGVSYYLPWVTLVCDCTVHGAEYCPTILLQVALT